MADMDSDGDTDIVAAEMEQGRNPDEVKVYLNQDGLGRVWVKQVIATTGSHSMRILDVDEDGDRDLYGANWEGNQVQLWLNQTCAIYPGVVGSGMSLIQQDLGARSSLQQATSIMMVCKILSAVVGGTKILVPQVVHGSATQLALLSIICQLFMISMMMV